MSEAELIYDDVNDVDEELAWLDYLTKERAGIMKERWVLPVSPPG